MEQQDIRWKQRFQNFGKATLRQAFQSGYIENGDLWLKALNDRNLTVHTYDDELAAEVIKDIEENYFQLLRDLYTWLKTQ